MATFGGGGNNIFSLFNGDEGGCFGGCVDTFDPVSPDGNMGVALLGLLLLVSTNDFFAKTVFEETW